VLRALRERRVYATNGARIVLRVALGGTPMGGVLPLAPGARTRETLFVNAIGTRAARAARGRAQREGRRRVAARGQLEATLSSELADSRAGEYVYVRVAQRDGGAAWSSPIYVGEAR
jgi:hypothetical protein